MPAGETEAGCRHCTTGTPNEARRWFRKNCRACGGTGVEPVTLVVEGVRVESEGNRRDSHWSRRAKRARTQGDLVRVALAGFDRVPFAAAPRLRVTFQRVMGKHGRLFDLGDNLNGSFKFCRDVVARVFAVDDGSDWWDWKYDSEQVRGKDYGVKITFEVLPAPGPSAAGGAGGG